MHIYDFMPFSYSVKTAIWGAKSKVTNVQLCVCMIQVKTHWKLFTQTHTGTLCLLPQRADVCLSQMWAAHPAIRHLCDHYVHFYISYIYLQGLTPSYTRHLPAAAVASYKPPRSGTYVCILTAVVVWWGEGGSEGVRERESDGKSEWGRRSNVNQSASVINMTKTRPAEGFPARSGAAAVVCQRVSSPSPLLVASSLASHQPPQACRLHFVVLFCFSSHIYIYIIKSQKTSLRRSRK